VRRDSTLLSQFADVVNQAQQSIAAGVCDRRPAYHEAKRSLGSGARDGAVRRAADGSFVVTDQAQFNQVRLISAQPLGTASNNGCGAGKRLLREGKAEDSTGVGCLWRFERRLQLMAE